MGDGWRLRMTELAPNQHLLGEWAGTQLRLVRVSFSGELAFELHIRPDAAKQLWDALSSAGLSPYGLEAMDVLRVEKGYLVGSEMNGQTTPLDLGMQRMLRADSTSVGVALLAREAMQSADRLRLTGVRAQQAHQRFLAGAQLTLGTQHAVSIGHVTSSVFSPHLQAWIGIALLRPDTVVKGAQLIARDPVRGLETELITTGTVHFDPENRRARQ